MHNFTTQPSSRSSLQRDPVHVTATRLVDNVGRDAAIRMCRANMWLGVLSEIERAAAN